MKRNRRWAGIAGLILVLLLVAGCGGTAAPAAQGEQGAGSGAEGGSGERVTLILGAYTTPREAYGEIIPLFQAHWKEQTGQDVVFEESYLGSGAQSRAIVEGFEADIAALSLEADINRIANAGLITHDWKAVGEYKGMVSTSIVVMAVRAGNPKGIQDWADLAGDGVEILTPDPATSGGAQWNVMAMYGAARRGHVDGFSAEDEGALDFLRAVFNNVTVLDKGARESITNYEKGIGDVAITYENEVLVGQANGQDYEYVIPSSTILIENPVAVIDANVDKHGTREVAEAFVAFLYRPEVQRIFAEHGLRSVDQAVAQATSEQYPAVEDLFTIEEFGGWSQVTEPFFGEEGIYTKMIQEVQGG